MACVSRPASACSCAWLLKASAIVSVSQFAPGPSSNATAASAASSAPAMSPAHQEIRESHRNGPTRVAGSVSYTHLDVYKRQLERYLLYAGGVAKGDVLVQMLEDLADLMEQAAVDRTPVRAIVGDDPVAFADDFLSNYSDGQWVNRERARLSDSIAAAEAAEQAGDHVTEPAGDGEPGGVR